MIQRIQSLLLLLAAICLIIAVFMPIATITTDNAQYLFTSWSCDSTLKMVMLYFQPTTLV